MSKHWGSLNQFIDLESIQNEPKHQLSEMGVDIDSVDAPIVI